MQTQLLLYITDKFNRVLLKFGILRVREDVTFWTQSLSDRLLRMRKLKSEKQKVIDNIHTRKEKKISTHFEKFFSKSKFFCVSSGHILPFFVFLPVKSFPFLYHHDVTKFLLFSSFFWQTSSQPLSNCIFYRSDINNSALLPYIRMISCGIIRHSHFLKAWLHLIFDQRSYHSNSF